MPLNSPAERIPGFEYRATTTLRLTAAMLGLPLFEVMPTSSRQAELAALVELGLPVIIETHA